MFSELENSLCINVQVAWVYTSYWMGRFSCFLEKHFSFWIKYGLLFNPCWRLKLLCCSQYKNCSVHLLVGAPCSHHPSVIRPFIKKYLLGLCSMWGTVLITGAIRSVAPPRSLTPGAHLLVALALTPQSSSVRGMRVSTACVTLSITGLPSFYNSEFGDYLWLIPFVFLLLGQATEFCGFFPPSATLPPPQFSLPPA